MPNNFTDEQLAKFDDILSRYSSPQDDTPPPSSAKRITDAQLAQFDQIVARYTPQQEGLLDKAKDLGRGALSVGKKVLSDPRVQTGLRGLDAPRQGVLGYAYGDPHPVDRAISQVTDPSKSLQAEDVMKKQLPGLVESSPLAATVVGTALAMGDPLMLSPVAKLKGAARGIESITNPMKLAAPAVETSTDVARAAELAEVAKAKAGMEARATVTAPQAPARVVPPEVVAAKAGMEKRAEPLPPDPKTIQQTAEKIVDEHRPAPEDVLKVASTSKETPRQSAQEALKQVLDDHPDPEVRNLARTALESYEEGGTPLAEEAPPSALISDKHIAALKDSISGLEADIAAARDESKALGKTDLAGSLKARRLAQKLTADLGKQKRFLADYEKSQKVTPEITKPVSQGERQKVIPEAVQKRTATPVQREALERQLQAAKVVMDEATDRAIQIGDETSAMKARLAKQKWDQLRQEKDLLEHPLANVTELNIGLNVGKSLQQLSSGLKSWMGKNVAPYTAPYLVSPATEDAAVLFRRRAGIRAAQVEMADNDLREASKYFDTLNTGAKQDFIQRIETGQGQTNVTLQAHANQLRRLLDKGRQDVENLGLGYFKQFNKDYFPHIWKDPKKGSRFGALMSIQDDPVVSSLGKQMNQGVMTEPMKRDFLQKLVSGQPQANQQLDTLAAIFKQYIPEWKELSESKQFLDGIQSWFGGKGSLAGRASFLKQRHYGDFQAGLAAGLEPVSDNPAELALMKYAEMQKFVAGKAFLEDLKDEGHARFFKISDPLPPGWRAIEDKIATKSRYTQGGFVKIGQYYAPEPVAKLINNAMSVGYGGTDSPGAKAFTRIREASNMMNLIQLGFSGFHVGTTTLNSAGQDMALAIMKANEGKFGQALLPAIRSVVPGASLIRDMRLGKQMEKAYRTGMGSPAVMDAVKYYVQSNMLMAERDAHVFSDGFVKALKDKNIAGAVMRAPFAAAEISTRPIFKYIVPRAKAGAYMDLLREEMSRLPATATEIDKLKVANRVADHMDNVFGKVRYDNYFWNAKARDLAFVLMRAPGWNIGTLRSMGGGFVDGVDNLTQVIGLSKPTITKKTAFLAGLTGVTAAYGAFYQFAMTGTFPEVDMKDPSGSLKNFIYPWTGGFLPNGEKERITLPSYVGKDVGHLFTALHSNEPVRQLADMATAKASPLLGVAYRIFYSNEDFRHQQIRDNQAVYAKQAGQAIRHVVNESAPFILQNESYAKKSARSAYSWTEAFGGITPASREITSTPAMKYFQEEAGKHVVTGARKEGDVQRSQTKRDFIDKMRNHKYTPGSIEKAIQKGELTRFDRTEIQRRSHLTPIADMTNDLKVTEMIPGYKLADRKERAKLLPILMKKYHNALSNGTLTGQDKQQVQQEMQQILANPFS